MSGGDAVLFISFACPKETNQRKRHQQNQPQFFLRKMANPALSEKLRFALLLDPLRTRCEDYSMFNKKCKNLRLSDRLKNQTPATFSPDCSGKPEARGPYPTRSNGEGYLA